MKIIAFTGMPFSGKSEAVAMAKTFGIPVVRMGDMVWEEVKRRGLILSDETVGPVAHEMRLKKGKDIWANRTIEVIESMDRSDCIVIDGIRNIEEIDAFKHRFGEDFFLVAIVVSDEVRHQRALARRRADDSDDINDIIDRDNREIQWGIREVIQQADRSFLNDGSLDSFCLEMKGFFESL